MIEGGFRQPVVAYEPKFDREAYAAAEAKDIGRLNAYTQRQLETHLGERFNVLLSKSRYEIKDGQIFGQDTNEPFMDMLKRGRDYRRKNGNPIDFAREDAEVVGLEAVSPLTSGEVGDKKVVVSPRGDIDNGSIYAHNFYDIFTVRQDQKGRYIEARRYSSALTTEETARRLRQAGLIGDDFEITAEHFLANPVDVPADKFATADDLHEYLHEEHDYTTEEEFDKVKRMTAFLWVSCLKNLTENPFDEESHLNDINAYINGGDMALDIVRGKNKYTALSFQQAFDSTDGRRVLAALPVRVVSTGCGVSGGFSSDGVSQALNAPFSVSEFGSKEDKYGSREFDCPDCHKKNLRPKDELIANCQHCKSANVAC